MTVVKWYENKTTDDSWVEISNSRNPPGNSFFQQLYDLVIGLIGLSHSNAEVERL